ncbi:MAG: fatty acid/phospholipid synthesis protein PlsX [Acutalibacteraceae bacterium]
MYDFFKSIIETDRAAVVVCDVNHTIVYMNKVAKEKYHRDLTDCSLLNCHNEKSKEMIIKIVDWFKKSAENNMIYTYKNIKQNKDVYMVALRDDGGNLIGYYEKHEYRNPETADVYDFSKSLI